MHYARGALGLLALIAAVMGAAAGAPAALALLIVTGAAWRGALPAGRSGSPRLASAKPAETGTAQPAPDDPSGARPDLVAAPSLLAT